MTRAFYNYAIFFAILNCIISLFQSTVYFRLGAQIYYLESFIPWFVCVNLISAAGLFLILLYYRYCNFVFSFWALSGFIGTTIFQSFVVFGMLMGSSQYGSLYLPAMLLSLCSGLVYSLSLITKPAGRRFWLKSVGVFGTVLGLVMIVTLIWSVNPTTPEKNRMVEKIVRLTSLIGSLGPLLFVMNFVVELKSTKRNEWPAWYRSLENTLVFAAIAASVSSFILGANVARESAGKISWEHQQAVKAKEWEVIFETRTFVGKDRTTLKYQLLKPLDYDASKSYPLVVCLPYGGGVEGSPAAQWLLGEGKRKKYPSFLFVPYCVEGKGWGGVPNYPTIDTLVFETIEALQKEFEPIDKKKIYVTGVSRGGYGSWHFITTRPDLFAAAVPVCGGGNPQFASVIVDVGVWAFHGEKDRNVPVESSRRMIGAIKKSGGLPLYTEFPGAGHNIWDQVTNTAGLLDWLFAQKKTD